MFRYGAFTGKIYDENVDQGAIGECCIVCEDGTALERAKAKDKPCELCRGCPEYYRED